MSSARVDPQLERSAAEFDAFASRYREFLNRSVRISGDTSDYFAAYKATYIARTIAPHGGKLLDYGCGIGLLAAHLKRYMPDMQIDGFDISKDCVDRMDESLLQQGIFSSSLREIGRSYDVIVLSNVLHHVAPAERLNLIREAGARLAPTGKLVIFEHSPLNPLTRWAVSQCAFDGDAILLRSSETLESVHEAGLKKVTRDFIVFFPRWLAWLRPLEPSLRACPLGAQYAVIAQRVCPELVSES